MKQKRKETSLLSGKTGRAFLVCLSFVLGGALCLGALSLLMGTEGSLGTVGAADVGGNTQSKPSYKGLDDKVEVLYNLSFMGEKDNVSSEVVNASMEDGGSLYITGNQVIVKSVGLLGGTVGASNVIGDGVDANILGGENNLVNANNVTLVAGDNNKIQEGSDNSTVLGGLNNSIGMDEYYYMKKDENSILLGGESSYLSGIGLNAIIGGSGNTLENVIGVTLLGGWGNVAKFLGEGIVGGRMIEVDQGPGGLREIFVFSDGHEAYMNESNKFSPEDPYAFYLDVRQGLGLDTQASRGGVESKGAVSLGVIDTTQTCNDQNYGLQGRNAEGCLIGCTKNGWEILDRGELCNPSANAEENITTRDAECTPIELQDRATLCNSNLLGGYKNVIFESSMVDNGYCTDDKPCIYQCKDGYHMVDGRCYQDCMLKDNEGHNLWDSSIKHNEIKSWEHGNYQCYDGTLKFACEANYHTEDGRICISNFRDTQCSASSQPANSVITKGQYAQEWKSGEGWTPSTIEWTFDESGQTECGYKCENGFAYVEGKGCLKEYTVMFDCTTNGGNLELTTSPTEVKLPVGTEISFGTNKITLPNGETNTLSVPTCKRDCYTMVGWYTRANSHNYSTKYTIKSTDANGNDQINLYAIYEGNPNKPSTCNSYLIAYLSGYNGVDHPDVTTGCVLYNTEESCQVSMLYGLNRTGWDFLGWNTDRTAAESHEAFDKTTNLLTLKAELNRKFWYTITKKEVSIDFIVNPEDKANFVDNKVELSDLGGCTQKSEDGMKLTCSCNVYSLDSYCMVGKGGNVSIKAPGAKQVKDGWVFLGWSHNGDIWVDYEKGNSVKVYTDGTKSKEYLVVSNECDVNETKVKYDCSTNGGQGEKTLPYVSKGEELIGRAPNCTVPNGYEFVGWNVDKTAHEGLETYSLQCPDPKTPVSLYAIYKKTISVNFDENNSTFEGESSPVTRTCDIYNKEGYCVVNPPKVVPNENTPIFMGWNKSPDATERYSGYDDFDGKNDLMLSSSDDNSTWYPITKSKDITVWIYFNANGNKWFTHNTSYLDIQQAIIPSSFNGTTQIGKGGTSVSVESRDFEPKDGYTRIGFSTKSNKHENEWSIGKSLDLWVKSRQDGKITLCFGDNICFERELVDNETYTITIFAQSKKELVVNAHKDRWNINKIDKVVCNLYSDKTETECVVNFPGITLKDGYTCQGWNTDKDATSSTSGVYTSNYDCNYSYKISESQSDRHWFAIIRKEPYTLKFVDNPNGKCKIDKEVKQTCSVYNLNTTCDITRKAPNIKADSIPNGYVAVGWNTNKDATSSSWNQGENKTVSLSSDQTYYCIVTDSTPPTLTFTDDVSGDWQKSDKVTVSWGDAKVKKYMYTTDSTCPTIKDSYTATTSTDFTQNKETNNGKYICLYAEDNGGNSVTKRSANTIHIDTGVPTCEWGTPTKTLIKAGDSGTITLTCDDTLAGVSTSSLASDTITKSNDIVDLSNASVVTNGNKKTYTFTYTAKAGKNGNVTFTLLKDKVVDKAGNKNVATGPSGIVTVDTTAPNAPTCNANVCFKDEVKNISCGTTSTDATVRYTTDGTNPTCNSTLWNGNKTFNATTTLKVIACDGAGNTSSVNTYTYTQDKSAPNTPTMVAEPTYTQGLSNTVSANTVSDNGCKGDVKYQFCKNTTGKKSDCDATTAETSSWSSNTSTTFSNLTDATKYYYFVRAKDGFDNTSGWSSSTNSTQDASLKCARGKPSLTSLTVGDEKEGTITLLCNGDVSGINTYDGILNNYSYDKNKLEIVKTSNISIVRGGTDMQKIRTVGYTFTYKAKSRGETVFTFNEGVVTDNAGNENEKVTSEVITVNALIDQYCPAKNACPKTRAGGKCVSYTAAELRSSSGKTCKDVQVVSTCQSDGKWDKDPGKYSTCNDFNYCRSNLTSAVHGQQVTWYKNNAKRCSNARACDEVVSTCQLDGTWDIPIDDDALKECYCCKFSYEDGELKAFYGEIFEGYYKRECGADYSCSNTILTCGENGEFTRSDNGTSPLYKGCSCRGACGDGFDKRFHYGAYSTISSPGCKIGHVVDLKSDGDVASRDDKNINFHYGMFTQSDWVNMSPWKKKGESGKMWEPTAIGRTGIEDTWVCDGSYGEVSNPRNNYSSGCMACDMKNGYLLMGGDVDPFTHYSPSSVNKDCVPVTCMYTTKLDGGSYGNPHPNVDGACYWDSSSQTCEKLNYDGYKNYVCWAEWRTDWADSTPVKGITESWAKENIGGYGYPGGYVFLDGYE